MKKACYLNALLICMCTAICGQERPQSPTSPTPPPTLQQQPAWTEHYRNATISFGRIVPEGGHVVFQTLGTGTIVAIDSRTGYIVSAKHMFDDPSQGWHPSELRVRFAWQEKESIETQFGVIVKLTDSSGQPLWRTLPDGSDIAALPLPINFNGLPLHAIGFQDFASPEDLFDGATIFVFGFPGIIGNDRLVRAVTRSGVVAWTDPSAPMENSFLLDANIPPGNSGGPVFKVPSGITKRGDFNVGGRVAFLGIVSQDISGFYKVTADGRIVQVKWPDLPLPSVEQVQVTGIGGLGKVEPASKIKKLVESMRGPLR